MAHKWRFQIFCQTDNRLEFQDIISDTEPAAPTVCPVNGAHTVLAGSSAFSELFRTEGWTDDSVITEGTANAGKTLVTDGSNNITSLNVVGATQMTAPLHTHAAAANGDDMTVSLTGGFDASLILSSTGTGTDAVNIQATGTGGGVSVTANQAMTLAGASISLNAGVPLAWPTADSTSGWLLSTNGSGQLNWKDPTTLIPSGGIENTWLIRDEKAWNIDGGTFNKDLWQTRDLNVISATGAGATNNVTLASNQVTFQNGSYIMFGSTPSFGVSENLVRWFNITDSVVAEIGTSAYSTNSSQVSATIRVSFTVTSGPKVYELQHYARNTRAGNGLGRSHSLVTTQNNIYSEIVVIALA